MSTSKSAGKTRKTIAVVGDTARLSRALALALQQELALGRTMVSVAKAQTDALRANNAAHVSALEARGRALIERQQELEGPRRAASDALAAALGFAVNNGGEDARPVSLAEMAPRLPAAEAKALLAIRDAILKTEKQLRAVNARNELLIENALEYVRFTIHALTDIALRPARYGVNVNAVAAPTFYVDQRA